MTDAALAALLKARNAAMEAIQRWSPVPLRKLNPTARIQIDALSAEFNRLDRAIVAELRRRDRPARLAGVVLWLTADRLNFVELDPGTLLPFYMTLSRHEIWSGSILHQYPSLAS